MTKNIKKVAISGLFAAFSLLLSFMGHYLVVPIFLGIKLDISDFPIFTSTLLFGPSYGYISLLAVSLIRTFSFSIAGLPGFFMRMVSSISVFFLGFYFKQKEKKNYCFLLSIVFYTILKIPFSYIFWTRFNSMPINLINSLITTLIIPYNFFKVLINTILSVLLYKKTKKIFKY